MAIFEYGGGNSGAGIREYLEAGKKQGRELHRDEIDQRIVLDGDLAICERIIDSRETDAERYDHITLSFKEKDISPETLRAIVSDFKAFVYWAYTEDEIYVYAEAHMPKTATEQKWNAETKKYETVERFPHIHFIIPKTNLVTGERLSILESLKAGYGTKNKTEHFTDALQESINEKYGLSSPKDNRRDAFASQADVISRIKEDEFTGKNRESLKMIRDMVIDQGIESPKDFRAMLEKLGEVSEGKGGEYLQVKLHGAQKNIRLKNYQFSAEFISKPIQEKLAFYTGKGKARSPKKKAEDLAKGAILLQKWRDRAREIKYLHTNSPFYKNTYAKATDAEKSKLLDALEAKYYDKLQEKHGYHNAALSAERGPDLAPEIQTEIKEQIDAIRLEEFASSKLNKTYLRTIEELNAAEEAGQKIIDAPAVAIDALTFNQSHFSELDLERHLLKNTSGPEQYDAAMKAVLACTDLVINDDDERGIRFTSKSIVAIEGRLVERAERMAGTRAGAVSSEGRQAIIDTTPFNLGQREAFELLCSERQLAVVNGAAGTGKSFVLAAMRKAYEAEGFTVHGAILQGKTAEDLQRDSGIESRTIARTLLDLDSGKFKLNAKSVLVVDEAGMVGSRDMERLMAHAEAAGARLRLVGDTKQLAAVEYGNAFAEVSARAEVASLTEIMRQRTEWQRQASEKFSVHNIEGLKDYADRGHVHLADTSHDAKIALVEAWKKHREEQPDQSRIVLAHTNADRVGLNQLMRAELKAQGQLKNEILVDTPRGKVPMAAGEQVMFTKADRGLGVKNGTTGTIQQISAEGVVTVALENGKTARFDAMQKGDSTTPVDYSYAVTVHKSQGMTVDAAFVLASKSMTKENLGVAMTRHRHDAQVFGSKEQFATIPEMLKTLDRAGQKAFTGDKSWNEAHRREDSVIGQYVADMNAAKIIEKAAQTAQYKEIAANLDPQRVLDYLSKSHHGLDQKKYSITTDDAGKKWIQDGDKKMGAATFLVKSLHLDYKTEAAPILKQCYSEQLAKAYSVPRYADGKGIDQTLKHEFAAYRKTRTAEFKKQAEAIDENRRTWKAEIAKANFPEATKAGGAAIVDRAIAADHQALKAKENQPTAETYKEFLAEKAPQSARHLDELARVSYTPADHARLKSIQIAQGIVPGLAQLTPEQLKKGIQNVIDRANPADRPPAAIIARNARAAAERERLADNQPRPEERAAALEADGGRGVHELPFSRVDAQGENAGVLLPNTVPRDVGDKQAGLDNDVRRASTGDGGRASDRSANTSADAPAIDDHTAAPVRRGNPELRPSGTGKPGERSPVETSKQPREPAPQALTTADRAELMKAEKQAARAAEREAQDREAKATAAAQVAAAAKAEAEVREQARPMAEIREQLAQVQADAHPQSFKHNAKISEASPADYTDHVDAVILASNEKFAAVQKGREIKIFKISELEKRLAYTGKDTGHGRFTKGNELEIKKGHKTDEVRAFIRERREEMKTEKQKKMEKERGI